jgi:RDD family
LVIGFSEGAEEPELGATLDNVLGFKPQQRLTVMELTDWKDWKEQMETFYVLRPDWGSGQRGDANGTYYRVKFHAEGTPFPRRAVARITDYVFLNSFVGYITAKLFLFLLAIAAGGRPPLGVLLRISHHRLPLFLASMLGSFAYQTICTSVHGSTLGKLMLSLQVLQHALDTKLDLKAGATKPGLEHAMKGHILGEAELMGRYGR